MARPAKRGRCRPKPSTAVTDHPVRPGSVLYQILEAVAARVAKRLRDGRHDASSKEELKQTVGKGGDGRKA